MGEVVEELLYRYLQPLIDYRIDTLILGCTHYPYLLAPIRRLMGPDVKIVDPAEAVAREARNELQALGLLNEKKAGEDLFFVSGDPDQISGCCTAAGIHPKSRTCRDRAIQYMTEARLICGVLKVTVRGCWEGVG